MEFTNFLSVDMITTFSLSIIVIELWVAFTKELPIIKKIPTKFYTWLIAVIHLAVINTNIGIFSLSILGIYLLLCNALIFSFLLCGGYDIAVGKITLNKNDSNILK